MPTVTVPGTGINLYYEEHGSGPPLLLIFGFTGNAQSWALQLRDFAPHFRCIVFDNRGVGRSSAPEGAYTIAEMAADAVAVLDAVGVERAHVLGYSMGGQIAQVLALTAPERVEKLVLTSTWAKGDRLFNEVIDVWGELYRQGVDLHTCVRYAYTWVLTDQFLDVPGALDQMLELAKANPFPAPPHGIWGQSRAILASDTLDRLPRIRARTLVMVGKQDILTPPKFAERLAAGIPGATLTVLERGGHGYLFENTNEFNHTVLAFLHAP